MKIYSIVVSLVAVAAIATAGYFYWQYSGVNKKITEVEQENKQLTEQKGKVEDQLTKLQTGFKDIKETAEAFKAVMASFTVPGNIKVGDIGSAEATKAREQIGKIADENDRTMGEKTWDDFQSSKLVTDLRSLLENLANNIVRNIANATPK